jgi:Ferritin-like domain
MTDLLEQFDVDGAIRETESEVAGDTRLAFLRKAGIGAGALIGGGALVGALPSIASAGTAASDVAILNYALTLEYLEAAFYAEALSMKKITDMHVLAFAQVVAKHEAQHVAFLKGALGSAAVAMPKFNFQGTTADPAKFMATSQVLEDTGVAAYLGQAGLIKSKKILGAAGSILAVEARHAGWIRNLNGVAGAPTAFQAPKTKAQVLAAVKATGFIVG